MSISSVQRSALHIVCLIAGVLSLSAAPSAAELPSVTPRPGPVVYVYCPGVPSAAKEDKSPVAEWMPVIYTLAALICAIVYHIFQVMTRPSLQRLFPGLVWGHDEHDNGGNGGPSGAGAFPPGVV